MFTRQFLHGLCTFYSFALLSLPPRCPALLPDLPGLLGRECTLVRHLLCARKFTLFPLLPHFFLPQFLSSLSPDFLSFLTFCSLGGVRRQGGNEHILSTYCVPGSLHIFSSFLIPSSFLFSPLSPCLSGLSALFQGKEQTFTEHLWYDNQLPVPSLLSSHPPFSLTCGLCYLCQGRKLAFIEHLSFARQSPYAPSALNSPCFFISAPSALSGGREQARMGHLLYIRQLMSHLISSCLYLPAPLPLPASPFPAFSRPSFKEDNKHLLSTSCVPHDLLVLSPLCASSPLPVLEVTFNFWSASFTGSYAISLLSQFSFPLACAFTFLSFCSLHPLRKSMCIY